MADDNKRYYWLKLNENFFEDDTIAWLEEQENGKNYVIFYLKLCLKSLQDNGSLIRYVGEKLIPYDVNALAKLTDTKIDTVVVAMRLFNEIGLISKLDGGEIYMNQINEMIGSETDSAKRMRRLRVRENVPSLCDNNVQECDTEIEKEIELELELEKEIDTDSGTTTLSSKDVDSIVNKWNTLTLQQLRSINKSTNRYKMLRARIKEYGIEDVIKAIENIKGSAFLKGQNNKGWTITFDWLVKPNNFIKVLEGNYTDKDKGATYGASTSNINRGQAKPVEEESEYDRCIRIATAELQQEM